MPHHQDVNELDTHYDGFVKSRSTKKKPNTIII